ncbi:GIY-YIG nuclease family protein [Pseudoalteromonas luteoviolacea]|uniref:GIY-YIG nuclease family protein n=1 Tax=Pseudoalteromonas luteoviolacea TaxID=43657 RepID=UPI001F2B1042|nr:GIY-YIG nuclease family protein [Pseudoalteromonas luteoviolacea]MCF6439525.1 GIY-YIG nuclease family protein [Pseudoalteromonas luteoviolacea]
MQPSVYILASKPYGTIYIGVTKDLKTRVYQHKNNLTKSFTSQYNVHNLVYFECYDSITTAIAREKQLKNWKRAWKIQLIASFNPKWQDLYHKI